MVIKVAWAVVVDQIKKFDEYVDVRGLHFPVLTGAGRVSHLTFSVSDDLSE